MSIAVICPGCKAAFRVSDKFAGKTGPCPKCKATIQVPAAAEAPEIKVHEPDAGPRDSKGRLVSRPLGRLDVVISSLMWAIAGGSVLAAFLAARLMGSTLQQAFLFRLLGLLAVTPPLAVAGYFVLRDREKLEVFGGRDLWLRTAICSAAYLAIWGAFGFVHYQYDIPIEVWQLFIILPPMLLLGSLAALGCYELEFGTAFMHYCFHLLVVLALCYVAGMHHLWPSMT